MRLTIRHLTHYRYESNLRYSCQYLRVTPYSNRSQRTVRWRINVPANNRLHEWQDGFGNICHTLVHEEPVNEIAIEASGTVETTDVSGILPSEDPALPVGVFLRQTPLTEPVKEIRTFAGGYRERMARDRIEGLHELMTGIRDAVEYRTNTTHVHTTAAAALADGYGVCQDHAHVFIACARHLGVPARYVSGYLYTGAGDDPFAASHAWAAAWVDDLGWLSFDVANRTCGTDRHVGVAVALDYAGALPVRGVREGADGPEDMAVEVQVQSHDQ